MADDGTRTRGRRPAHGEPVLDRAFRLFGSRHRTVAALSVVTRSERLEPAAVRPAVVAVARAISRAVSTAAGAQHQTRVAGPAASPDPDEQPGGMSAFAARLGPGHD